MKPPDKDITEALAFLEEEIPLYRDIGDEELVQEFSRQLTLIRRLAREAGYDIPTA